MKIIPIITSLSVLAILSSACNTTIGLGRDMRILGESMENQAQKNKRTSEVKATEKKAVEKKAAEQKSAAPVY